MQCKSENLNATKEMGVKKLELEPSNQLYSHQPFTKKIIPFCIKKETAFIACSFELHVD